MKIYTKTGDQGETGLLGGVRVQKNHECIEICGGLDELNSALGIAIAAGIDDETAGWLNQVQVDLFDLGGQVAAALSPQRRSSSVGDHRITELELQIDLLQNRLEPLTAFILPGGGLAGSHIHWARTICRRVERRLVSLIQQEVELDFCAGLVYLNRLSDFLFVVARYVNGCDGQSETKWVPNKPGA